MSLHREKLVHLFFIGFLSLLFALCFAKTNESTAETQRVRNNSETVEFKVQTLETKANLIINRLATVQAQHSALVSDILKVSEELKKEIVEISETCSNYTNLKCGTTNKMEPVDKPWWVGNTGFSFSMRSIRLQNLLLIFTTLRPLFIVLGMISAIQYGIYGFRKARQEMTPVTKKVWAAIVHEISFCSSFDYMIDFCPKQQDIRQSND